jgi:hypothetical protein
MDADGYRASPDPGDDSLRPPLRRHIVIATLGVAVVEWLLFELIRSPYDPPRDMRTFLGQEKYPLFGIMAAIVGGWSLYLLYAALRHSPTRRDALAFAALLAFLTMIATIVVYFRPWTVTPLDWICR